MGALLKALKTYVEEGISMYGMPCQSFCQKLKVILDKLLMSYP